MSDMEDQDKMEAPVQDLNKQKDRFMTFKCGDEFYGIAISYVEEITTIQSITEVPQMDPYVKGLINLRGKIVPVIDVRIRFGKEPIPYNDRTCIMILKVKDTLIGLIIDTISEVVNIPTEEIVPPPKGEKGTGADRFVYGIGKVDGQVKLLIKPETLIFDTPEEESEEEICE
ncbi:MAG: purine-binding chemotaxis protein CheW [Lachnospiraceae bacterium]|nr:purine-binding chemotaxis protein CheW [Lachnospiraceae bacterium]